MLHLPKLRHEDILDVGLRLSIHSGFEGTFSLSDIRQSLQCLDKKTPHNLLFCGRGSGRSEVLLCVGGEETEVGDF